MPATYHLGTFRMNSNFKDDAIIGTANIAAENDGQRIGHSIVIAVLTYKRPDTLNKLLSEFVYLNCPDDLKLTLLVIDNDELGSARELVDSWRTRIRNLHYVVEHRRGIPVARNRGIDEALALEASALCFIDDDEYTDRQWIAEMVECWKKTGAHLMGGPVEVAPAPAGATFWQKMINSSLAGRARRKYRSTARAAAGKGRYTIITNNWLCDMDWLKRSGLRFNERMLVSGGSDTEFFRRARAYGCVTTWCSRAFVYETMTLDRLSMLYQFNRGASQSMTHFKLKTPHVGWLTVLKTVPIAVLRAVLGVFLLIIPVYGRASPIMAVRSMGWAVGRIMGLFGKQSKLYQ